MMLICVHFHTRNQVVEMFDHAYQNYMVSFPTFLGISIVCKDIELPITARITYEEYGDKCAFL